MGSGIKKTFGEVEAAFTQRGFKLLSTEYKNANSPLNCVCDQGHQTKIRYGNLQSGSGCLECSGLKKKTFEEVEAAFNQRGFTLLSKDYISNKSPLNYLCDQGHQNKIAFSDLQRGRGCAKCDDNSKKKTIEEVRQFFTARNYTLLSTEYKNSSSPLDYICSQGHQATIRFDDLRSGKGCAECAGLKKKTIEEVRELFASRNYTLLSTEYRGNHSPLKYICGKGHQSKICFGSLQKGHGCLECSGSKKKTIEEVRELFVSRNYTLLSTEYKNCMSSLNYLCSNGHNATISFNSLQKGHGCAECSGKKTKTIEEVRELFTARDYTLLSTEYTNNSSPLKYLCDQGHQTKISFNQLKNGRGCPSCANHGFDPSKSAILYYLRFQFEGNFYYKIGITNRKISERFQSESTSYTVIKESDFALGKDAHTQEQAILKKFSASRYKGKPFLRAGNTELFTRDVLQLDYEPFQDFAA